MPNRIIKETVCTSDKLNELSDFEFRLWIGLLLSADDAGRGDARPAIIKGRCFPLRERVTVKDIERALHGLAAHSCISLYTVGGKSYYVFPTWAAHQRIDRAKPKYPAPEDAENEDSPQVAADCRKSPQVAADCRNSRAESNPKRIQKESKSNTNPTETCACAREEPPPANTIESYASGQLSYLSPSNMAELADFMDDLPEDLIRHAIDEACAQGKRTWAYVRSILQRYLQAGFQTIGDVKAAEAARQRGKPRESGRSPANPALNYSQREHTDADYSDLFINLEEV